MPESKEKVSQKQKKDPVPFHFETHQRETRRQVSSDWRSELRNRINQHSEKRAKEVQRRSEPTTPPESGEQQGREIEHPLFQYKLGEAEEKDRPERRIVTSSRKVASPPITLEKPLIRMSVVGRPRRTRRAEQRKLRLEPLLSKPAEVPVPGRRDSSHEVEAISREVLFSRLLAGIVDLLSPALIGLFFTFLASEVLNFELFAVSSLRLVFLFSLSFFFFNSFFFLLTSRQTPGMFLTDLQLIDEESDDPSLGSICLRICLFLPVAATVVGLVSGFFDRRCRCLHDRLSQTRVVPVQSASETRPGAQSHLRGG